MQAPTDYPLRARNDRRSAQLIQVEARQTPLLIVICLLCGLALMGAMWAISEARRAQTRADLAQLEVESFKNVLHSLHLPTNTHLPGEKP
jgi:hypothetical protein